MSAADRLEKALTAQREAFFRWCELEDLAAELGTPYAQAFEAGWNAAIAEAVRRFEAARIWGAA